ncbi:light-harvesting protein [Nannochloropsis oceanica]
MKFLTFATVVGTASAFLAPAPMHTRTQGRMYMADQAPVDEEMRSIALPFAAKPQNLNGELAGDVGFDPFKFTDKGDVAKFRVAELKHGRVAMLAVVGVFVQELYQWNDNFPSKNFLEALKTAPPLGLLQLFVFLGAYDVTTSKFDGRVPGDIGFDPLRLSADGLRENWQLAELKHGRLAMIAFLAFVVQASISDKPILEQTFEWAKSFA